MPADPDRRAGPTSRWWTGPRPIGAARHRGRQPPVRPDHRDPAAGEPSSGSPDEQVLVIAAAPHRHRRMVRPPVPAGPDARRTPPARRAGAGVGAAAVQYADYTLWQRDLLGDPPDPASLAAGSSPTGRRLSTVRRRSWRCPPTAPGPRRPSFAGGAIEHDARRRDDHAALRSLARTSGTSMFMVLHAASAALLHRLGAGDDMPIGAPIAGRTDEAPRRPGRLLRQHRWCCAPTCPATRRSTELLARVRDTDLAAFSHADVPFEPVVETVNPARTAGPQPAVPGDGRLPQPDRRRRSTWSALEPRWPFDDRHGKVRPGVQLRRVRSTTTGSSCALEYATELFDRATAETIARRQRRGCSDAVGRRPGRAVGDLDVLLGDERALVVLRLQRHRPAGGGGDVYRGVRAPRAPRPPTPSPSSTTTRSSPTPSWSDRADRIAAAAARRGVGAGDVVGVAVPALGADGRGRARRAQDSARRSCRST